MNAEIIAVGSELLTHQRVDTNSLYLTDQLNALGIEVVTKCVIGDQLDRLADAIRRAVARSEVVILSGGLGPTEDDLTRDVRPTPWIASWFIIPKSPHIWNSASPK